MVTTRLVQQTGAQVMLTGGTYYGQDTLWGCPPETYQQQVQADILDLLPTGITTVLDVGCGDGYITNALPAHLHVVGMELSDTALTYVQRDRVLGSIAEIPFADGAFDAVMANDTLEHIPDAIYTTALRELMRVASRYILITVPHREQLEANHAQCADCGLSYHINWHQRCYDAVAMKDLFHPSFRPLEIRWSGDVTLPPYDPTLAYRHQLGLYRTWRGAVCTHCGSSRQVAADESAFSARMMGTLRSLYWIEVFEQAVHDNHRTEIMALYTKSDLVPSCATPPLTTSYQDWLYIDFANPLQEAIPDFVPGLSWARYHLPAGGVRDAQGLRSERRASEGLVIRVRVPVKAEIDDRLQLRVSGNGGDDRLEVYVIDGLLGRHCHLSSFAVEHVDEERTVKISRPWLPDQFGLALELHLFGQTQLHHLHYLPATKGNHKRPFVRLESEYQVIRWQYEGLIYSWGVKGQAGELYPQPPLVWDAILPSLELMSHRVVSCLLQLVEAMKTSLQQEWRDMCSILEDTEQQRQSAEQAYIALQGQYQTLQDHTQVSVLHFEVQHQNLIAKLEEKEKQRDFAENTYALLQQEYQAIASSLSEVRQVSEELRLTLTKVESQRVAAEETSQTLREALAASEAQRVQVESQRIEAEETSQTLREALAASEAQRVEAEEMSQMLRETLVASEAQRTQIESQRALYRTKINY